MKIVFSSKVTINSIQSEVIYILFWSFPFLTDKLAGFVFFYSTFNSPVLQCDCYLKKVLKFSRMRDVKITDTECALPKKLMGRSVGDLRPKELVCSKLQI